MSLLISSAVLSISFGVPNIVKASETDSSNTEEIEFSTLTAEEKTHFENEGFTDENEYFSSTIVQLPEPGTETGLPTRAARAVLNVITIRASTKRENSTTGYTSYIITASKAPFLKLDTKITYGSKSRSSSVIPYGKPYVYNGGVYFTNTGKATYYKCKVASQYTTSMGVGTAFCSAGSVTLGKGSL